MAETQKKSSRSSLCLAIEKAMPMSERFDISGVISNIRIRKVISSLFSIEIGGLFASVVESNASPSIGELELQEEKLFKRTSSKNKQKLQEVLSKITNKAEKEEVIKELEKVIVENNIDNRVFNGKEAEEKFCEFLTNDQVWLLIKKCHARFASGKICASSAFNRFLKAFAIAFYEELNEKEGIWDGKTALLHRFAESQLGEKLTMGVRALQKGIAEIRSKIMGKIRNITESWMNKFNMKMEGIMLLIKQIRAFLSETIQTMTLKVVD